MKKIKPKNKAEIAIKAWCIFNKEWKDWGWNNPLQELPFCYRDGSNNVVYPLAIFETLKTARFFYKYGNKKEIKIIKCKITF